MKVLVAAVAASMAAYGAALADPATLSGDALRQTVSGKTVVLNTPVGGIPISYRDNGTMQGRAKEMQIYAGQADDRGHWWVQSNKLCQKWNTWMDGRSHCFSVRLDGRTVHWRADDGRTGTATIASN